MFKQACGILLIAVTAAAQDPLPASSESQSIQHITIYRTYSHLRRGTSEDVLIVVKPEGQDIVALSGLHLQVLANGGLTVTDIRYPNSRMDRTMAGGPLAMVATPVGDYRIKFKVHARKDVLDDRAVLSSTLTYKLRDKSGAISEQRVDLGIEFAMADQHARTFRNQWPSPGLSKAQQVGMILLIPLLPVLYLVGGIVCVATYDNGCSC